MEIRNASVREINAGRPELYVVIEGAVPGLESFVFEQRGNLFVAERDGVVRYFAEGRPQDGTGFGSITIPMDDQSQRTLERAWSSRPGVVNQYFPERPVIDVAVGEAEKPGSWRAGYALTLARAQEVLTQHLPGWSLQPTDMLGEPEWLPSPTPDAVSPARTLRGRNS